MQEPTLDEVTQFMKKAHKDQTLNSLRNQPRGIPPGWDSTTYTNMLRKMYDGAIKAGATPEEIKAVGFTLFP